MTDKKDTFTIIMLTFDRPAMLKEAVNALFRQTYDNLEIIIINNAATPETVKYLHEIEALDSRIKLVHFKENQYDPNDPSRLIEVCYNAALEIATGDYVWYQADDDLIADDYAEKMVALFQGNSECTTAAGLPVSIDANGNIMHGYVRTANFRPRYVAGRTLVLDYLRGGKMFSTPGTIFTIKRDVLIKAGGYARDVERSQLLGIVPFGVTGFDETAIFYWRHHDLQLNKQWTALGWLGIDDRFALLRDWEIERRWQVFGKDVAREVVSSIKNHACQTAAKWFAINLSFLRFSACLRIVKKMWNRPYFWLKIPQALFEPFYKRTRQLLVHLKPAVRCLFKIWPGLANVSASFARLRDKANR